MIEAIAKCAFWAGISLLIFIALLNVYALIFT